jgi:hypothetical protein
LTTQQMQTLIGALRRVEAKVDAIEIRLSGVYPYDHEIAEQIEAELDKILTPGGSIRVFADDR